MNIFKIFKIKTFSTILWKPPKVWMLQMVQKYLLVMTHAYSRSSKQCSIEKKHYSMYIYLIVSSIETGSSRNESFGHHQFGCDGQVQSAAAGCQHW